MKEFSFKYLIEYGYLLTNLGTWKLVNYPGIKDSMYEVSYDGKIRRADTKVEMSYRNHKGYLTTQLMTTNGKSREFRIHRIVAFAFVPDYQPGLVVNHKDGVKTNNSYWNLEWVTQYENVKHAELTGLTKHISGEDVNTATLTNDEVNRICRSLIDNNGSVQIVSQKFPDVDTALIRRIKNKETWKSISDKYFDKNTFKTGFEISSCDIEMICETLIDPTINGDVKLTVNTLKSSIPGITDNIVNRIKNKSNYQKISDKFFDASLFRQRLLPEDAEEISRYIKIFKGDKQKVLDKLSDNPRVNMSRINHILKKESHVEISDRFFRSDEFKINK